MDKQYNSLPPGTLLFIHIPKTAGTSFRSQLGKKLKCAYDYGGNEITHDFVRHFTKTGDRDAFLKSFYEQELEAICGHCKLSKYLPLLNDECKIATFLRDPIQRTISEYYHLCRHYNYRKSLKDFIRNPSFINRQLEMMKGVDYKDIFFLGMTEDYENSINFFNQITGLNIANVQLNSNPQRLVKNHHEVQSDDIKCFDKYNEEEIFFYEEAKKVCQKRLKECGIQISFNQGYYKPGKSEIKKEAEKMYSSSSFSSSFVKDMIKFSLNSKVGVRRYHITRLYMYTQLQNVLAEYDSASKSCLAISHSSGLAKVLGLASVTLQNAHYPEYNFTNLKFEDNSFDFCLSDQVLEHIEGNPLKGFEESIRIVKPGGFIAHTTCFVNQIHEDPGDFWRFTPKALKFMSESYGAEVINYGGWGNKEAWSYIDMGYRAVKIPEDQKNPIYQLAMKNDPSCPIVTWVVARIKE